MNTTELDKQTYKEKIAIVVVGYNRLGGISRLLDSINHAYYDIEDVPLVISIDASGNKDLYDYVRQFEWKHGDKIVNIQEERLGLKKHIFQCASLTKFFKGIVLLEDDLFVSPNFYHYCDSCLEKYGSCSDVAGISLYSEEINGYVGFPFQPYQNEYDVYAWQTVCSWGQVWNVRMWNGFSSWLIQWNEDFESIDMISDIKKWTRAWSKYYYAYMIQNNKYFIYPYQSLTTNFNDAGGEHGGGNASIVQVSLLQGKRNYIFGEFENLVKYDVYGQNKAIAEWLGIPLNDLTVDYYGLKDVYRGHYVLAPFHLPYKLVRSYSLSLRPWELNIKYGIEGGDIHLYYKEDEDTPAPQNRIFPYGFAAYYLRGFNFRTLLKYTKKKLVTAIKRRLKLSKV